MGKLTDGPHFDGVHTHFPDLLEGSARTAVMARGVKMEGSLPKVSSTLSIRADQGLQSSLGGLNKGRTLGGDQYWRSHPLVYG